MTSSLNKSLTVAVDPGDLFDETIAEAKAPFSFGQATYHFLWEALLQRHGVPVAWI